MARKKPLGRREARAIATAAAVTILEQTALASEIWDDQYDRADCEMLCEELLKVAARLAGLRRGRPAGGPIQ